MALDQHGALLKMGVIVSQHHLTGRLCWSWLSWFICLSTRKWENAPPRAVRAMSRRRPAHHRSSPTQSPRLPAPWAPAQGCALGVLTRPPRLCSPLGGSRPPWPPPSPRSTATALRTSPGAAPARRGCPTHASPQRRPTTARGAALLCGSVLCSGGLSQPQRLPPPPPPSPVAAPRGPTLLASLCSGAASDHLCSGPTAPGPLRGPRGPPRPWWPHSGSRPEARGTPQGGGPASRVHSGAKRPADASVAAEGAPGRRYPPVAR